MNEAGTSRPSQIRYFPRLPIGLGEISFEVKPVPLPPSPSVSSTNHHLSVMTTTQPSCPMSNHDHWRLPLDNDIQNQRWRPYPTADLSTIMTGPLKPPFPSSTSHIPSPGQTRRRKVFTPSSESSHFTPAHCRMLQAATALEVSQGMLA